VRTYETQARTAFDDTDRWSQRVAVATVVHDTSKPAGLQLDGQFWKTRCEGPRRSRGRGAGPSHSGPVAIAPGGSIGGPANVTDVLVSLKRLMALYLNCCVPLALHSFNSRLSRMGFVLNWLMGAENCLAVSSVRRHWAIGPVDVVRTWSIRR